jgi:hypothetical protein
MKYLTFRPMAYKTEFSLQIFICIQCQISGQSVLWEPSRYKQTEGWTDRYTEAQKMLFDPGESPYKLRIVESDS